jgi:L-ascorbate metabolism protein UlaG (beta-lactamase superfamily)
MASTSATTEQIPVRVLGGPTALFEYGGLRFLTDPTFDAPGDYQVPGGQLTKTAPSCAAPADLGRIDVVLLSHDEHPDNLDNSGRALLADVPLTLTTPGGGQRLGNGAKGLAEDRKSVV